MENKCCKDCGNFRQHYSLGEGRLFRVYCGHCVVWSRPKQRKPDAGSCEKFTPAPAAEEEFTNKEYLRKTLLKHVLNMELLPEIEEIPENNAKR